MRSNRVGNRRTSYTTGEVAVYLEVSVSKVKRLIENGWLKGYLLPLSEDRRVSVGELVAAMEREGIPIPLGLRGGLPPGEAERVVREVADSLLSLQTTDKTAGTLLRGLAGDLLAIIETPEG